jgi:hypothetical protein
MIVIPTTVKVEALALRRWRLSGWRVFTCLGAIQLSGPSLVSVPSEDEELLVPAMPVRSAE